MYASNDFVMERQIIYAMRRYLNGSRWRCKERREIK